MAERIRKVLYVAFIVIAIAFYVIALVVMGDIERSTWFIANGCFCMLVAVMVYIDSKVEL